MIYIILFILSIKTKMNSDLLRTSNFNKSKFNHRSPTVDRESVNRFSNQDSGCWSNANMYRTNYRDMSDKVSYFQN
jgi:hypothetical protein